MKKSLIALAAVAATSAFAQSSVQLVGTFDPGVANQKTTYANGNSVAQNLVFNNGQGTSQITFKGTEDLGGGLKASFLYENDFFARFDANGNSLLGKTNFGTGGGEQFLALEGGAGKLQVGAANTPTLTAQASRQPIGTKIGSGFGTIMGTAHVRNNNSLVYSSPVFSGLSAQLGYAFKTNADVNAATAYNLSTGASTASLNTKAVGDITDLGLNYANGPFRAGLSYYTVAAVAASAGVGTTIAATTAAAKNEQTNLYAQYDVAGATLYGGYHTEKTGTTLKADGWNVAVKYALTPSVNLLANYGQLNDKLAANGDKKVTAIGAQYVLSKNTSLYARYVDESYKNVSTAASTTDGSFGVTGIKTALIGMQTNF